MSYLRGFKRTGWLITVLARNITDAIGFVSILMIIIIGFSVCFTAMLSESAPDQFETFENSIISTFTMAVNSDLDLDQIHNSEYPRLAKWTMVLIIFIVTIVALNAFIALLGDSYQSVQENSTANMRMERANIVIEYLVLINESRRKEIERDAIYFHKLVPMDPLEKEAIDSNMWEGQLKAIKVATKSIVHESISEVNRLMSQRQSALEDEIIFQAEELRDLREELSLQITEMRKQNSEMLSLVKQLMESGHGTRGLTSFTELEDEED